MLRKKIPAIRADVVSIDVVHGSFTKQYDTRVDDMAAKYALLEEIATQSEFCIPKVLEVDRDQQTISQMYMPDLTPVRLLLQNQHLMPELMGRIGRGLAQVHAGLSTLDIPAINLPSGLDADSEKTFLHLDFNTVNVQMQLGSKDIYFLDWELSPMLKSLGNFGSIYFDVVHFIYQIYLNEPYLVTGKKWKDKLVAHFLLGYRDSRGALDLGELANYAESYLAVFEPFDQKVWWKYQLKRANLANFRQFVRQLSTSGTLLCVE